MANKPSERRNYREPTMTINLTPMMNLVAILIPILLVSTVLLEVAVIDVAAPPDTPVPSPHKKAQPLNLIVTVTTEGYTLAGTSAALDDAGAPGPTIPVTQRDIPCHKYIGTWPPPRQKNRSAPKCAGEDDTRRFWVYDTALLQQRIVELKNSHPQERRIIIAAEPGISFEALTDVMDASRQIVEAGGEPRILFDEVVLSPGLT